MQARFADPIRQTVIGHLLFGMIERACARGLLRAPRSPRAIGLLISGIPATIDMVGEVATVHGELLPRVSARLVADMATLVRVARGGSLVGALLRRRIRVRGNPLALWPLLALLRLGRDG